jgi:hypothetical protein
MVRQYNLHIIGFSTKLTHNLLPTLHIYVFKLPTLFYFYFSEEILVRECRNTSSISTPVEEMVEVCQDPDQEATLTDADDGACTLR